MPIVKSGGFSLNLGVFKMDTTVTEDDRQSAWEVYTEIVTRVAVYGKTYDPDCRDFSGEVLSESLSSLHAFFGELRSIMRKFPVGRPSIANESHLGVLINDAITNILRPFLEKWQAHYRWWYETSANPKLPPFTRQKDYPQYDEFIEEWRNLRLLMRFWVAELAEYYSLVDTQETKRLLAKKPKLTVD